MVFCIQRRCKTSTGKEVVLKLSHHRATSHLYSQTISSYIIKRRIPHLRSFPHKGVTHMLTSCISQFLLSDWPTDPQVWPLIGRGLGSLVTTHVWPGPPVVAIVDPFITRPAPHITPGCHPQHAETKDTAVDAINKSVPANQHKN